MDELSQNMNQSERIGEIVKALMDGRIPCETLPEHTRLLCVEHMDHEMSMTQWQMASALGLSRSTIQRDLWKLKDIAVAEIGVFETERIAKELIVSKNRCQGQALQRGDIRLYWDIEVDTLDRLGRMGYIKYSTAPVKVHIGNNVLQANVEPGVMENKDPILERRRQIDGIRTLSLGLNPEQRQRLVAIIKESEKTRGAALEVEGEKKAEEVNNPSLP